MSAGTCMNCGSPLEPNAAFCIICGTPVAAGGPAGGGNHTVVVGAGPGPMGGAAPTPYQPTAPAGAAPAASNVCPACGAPLEPDAAFCIVCGKPVQAQGGAAPAAPAPGNGTVVVSQNPGGIQQPAQPANVNPGPVAAAPVSPNPAQKPAAPVGPGTHTVPADELDMYTQLVFLTREEAAKGCSKIIEVDGKKFQVSIPAGTNAGSKLDFPGYGYVNDRTHQRGILRLNFYID